MNLIKPPKLNVGDTVATVSLSAGYAGNPEKQFRYYQGKERLEKIFGLHVVEMPHTLATPDFVYNHPEKRAEDFMAAFTDPFIKGIISCIGGDDTIRLLPYINFEVIRNNPKVFMGYSDTTINHFMCYKAGLSSFYGTAVFSDLAENVTMPEYTINSMKKSLFSTDPIGRIEPSETWSCQYLPWAIENNNTAREFKPNTPHELLQGSGTRVGRLIGGCIEVFDWLRGTTLFPKAEDFNGTILFFETSEETPPPSNLLYMLRSFGAMGILNAANGMVWGKPQGGKYYDEYKPIIRQALAEVGRSDMPVLYNLSFGHNEPKCVIPYGAMAEIDCGKVALSILESGVQ